MDSIDKLMEIMLGVILSVAIATIVCLAVYFVLFVLFGMDEDKFRKAFSGLFRRLRNLPSEARCRRVRRGTVLVKRPVSAFSADIVFAAVIDARKDLHGRPEVRIVRCDESGSFATRPDGNPVSGTSVRYVSDMFAEGWTVYKR